MIFMAKLRTWQVKNKNMKRKYKSSVGMTDYDIPVFGYRSALLILLITFGSLLLVPQLCEWLRIDYRLPTVLFGGIISGFSVAFSQFFIETKTCLCKSFWIVGALLSVFVSFLIFLVVYAGVIA